MGELLLDFQESSLLVGNSVNNPEDGTCVRTIFQIPFPNALQVSDSVSSVVPPGIVTDFL
jgi:hypothetical protein